MAHIRPDYNNSWWPRMKRWLQGGSTELDDEMTREYDESREGHLVSSIEEAQAREDAQEERVRRQLAEALCLPVAVGAHFIELDLVHRQHGDLRAGKNGVEENKHHL